jgi:hypothetical protein
VSSTIAKTMGGVVVTMDQLEWAEKKNPRLQRGKSSIRAAALLMQPVSPPRKVAAAQQVVHPSHHSLDATCQSTP